MTGTYVSVKFADETLNALVQLQEKLRLYDPVPIDKLHATIVYSRTTVDGYKPDTSPKHIGVSDSLTVFETKEGKRALVLLLKSDFLHKRHEYGNILGATYDFPDYQPHITLSYDIGARDINIFVDPIDIVMESEYIEALDLEWKP